ncbi:MAG: C39 family peptidase [Caldilineaceae bacterium]|nr:C39 family peptidase [Caldilineaceae bacterium]
MLFQPPAPQYIPIPHIPQQDIGDCLAACAAMACAWIQIDVSYDRLLRLLQVQTGVGAPFPNVERLTQLGCTVTHQRFGTLALLYDFLAKGWPVIVSVQAGELDYWQTDYLLHAVLVVGMTSTEVILNDPGLPMGAVRATLGDFDLAWAERDERYAVLSHA